MGKIVHVMLYVFAFLGFSLTVLGGYTYASNSELFSEFWDVKDDYKAVPEDRRQEVLAELPARITFERDVAEDLNALPEERRTALYEQLKKSRDASFEAFKMRIHAEAEIARKIKDTEDKANVVDAIKKELGTVNVGIDLTGKKKSAKSQLSGVKTARANVAKAMEEYDALDGSVKTRHINAAIEVLSKLDGLGNEVVKARKKNLSSDDKSRLSDIVGVAKRQLYEVKKYTPGLGGDSRFKKYVPSIGKKLSR
ncbi:MAG: hypothetical protein V3V10_06585 [Planctomycetota bacterium]